MIVEREPQVLLRSEVATAGVDDRASLVASLLTLYKEKNSLTPA
jgi:hypothetical protein